ncbi:hypothetical protein, partial [Nonomuraea dietziae]
MLVPRTPGRLAVLAAAVVLGLVPSAPALAGKAAAPPTQAGRAAAPPATSDRSSADLDALFVGAHPDDEAFTLSTLGQWKEDHDIRTG